MLNEKLTQVYNEINGIDEMLVSELRKIKSFKILPVFFIWEKAGLFCTNKTLHIIINIARKINKLIL